MADFASRNLILVADDQAFIRSLLISMLRELNYRTLDASDSAEAMRHLERNPYAAILDQRMAGQTGLEILQAVRSGCTRSPRDLPVLLLTGHADEHIVRIAGELDVSALLSKPISKEQLGARLDAIAKTEIELKAPRSYALVDVDPAECAAPPRQTSSAWILRETIIPRNPASATTAKTPLRRRRKPYMRRGDDIHYSRLEAGMVLARDLYTANGTLLLAAGSEINKAMVKRLRKVCEDNANMTYLTVVAASGGSSGSEIL